MSRVEQAIEKYVALLELEKSSYSKTTHARNAVIRSLNDNELPDFALRLKQIGALKNDLPDTRK